MSDKPHSPLIDIHPSKPLHRAEDATREEKLHRALRDWKATFNAINDQICLLDRDGTILQCNESMSKLLNLTEDQIVGRKCHELMHSSNAFFQGCPYQEMLRTRKREGFELALDDMWYMVTADPIFGEAGEITGAVHIIRDITDRKRAEEALQKSEEVVRQLPGKLLIAQEAERRLLAREMHDDLTQRLAVLAIEAGKLEQELGLSGTVPGRLRVMKEQLIKLSEDVHTLSRQLHPSILDDLGLVDALRSECSSFSQREGIAVRCTLEPAPANLPTDIALCLYRIAQEGLRNIAKHADVKEASISLASTEEGILLSVEDAGFGFDPAQFHGKPGLGLASMEERARLIGGDFSLRSEPGKGTLIEVWAPLGEIQ